MYWIKDKDGTVLGDSLYTYEQACRIAHFVRILGGDVCIVAVGHTRDSIEIYEPDASLDAITITKAKEIMEDA